MHLMFLFLFAKPKKHQLYFCLKSIFSATLCTKKRVFFIIIFEEGNYISEKVTDVSRRRKLRREIWSRQQYAFVCIAFSWSRSKRNLTCNGRTEVKFTSCYERRALITSAQQHKKNVRKNEKEMGQMYLRLFCSYAVPVNGDGRLWSVDAKKGEAFLLISSYVQSYRSTKSTQSSCVVVAIVWKAITIYWDWEIVPCCDLRCHWIPWIFNILKRYNPEYGRRSDIRISVV